MSILDTPRSQRREMMRAGLRAREKAIRAGDPNPPEVRDLRIPGNVSPDRWHAEETRLRADTSAEGFSPAQLAAKGAAARKAERRAQA